MAGISVKLPLEWSEEDGFWSMNKTLRESVKQNFRMLLFTAPGERIMIPDFGVGIRNFLFENEAEDEISSRIYEQTQKYMKFLKINKISFKKQDNTLHCSIFYEIPNVLPQDVLSATIPLGQVQ